MSPLATSFYPAADTVESVVGMLIIAFSVLLIIKIVCEELYAKI